MDYSSESRGTLAKSRGEVGSRECIGRMGWAKVNGNWTRQVLCYIYCYLGH